MPHDLSFARSSTHAAGPSRPRRSLLALATAVATTALGAGCASRPEIHHDRDPRADFASYRTFAFQEPRDPARGALGSLGGEYTTLHEARLRQAATQELERHGLRQVAHDPDLRVHVAMKVVQRQELHTSPGARGFGPGYRGWSTTRLETTDVRQGTLVVDLVDARRNALVWRGMAEGAVTRDEAQDPGATIERAMAEVLAGFKR